MEHTIKVEKEDMVFNVLSIGEVKTGEEASATITGKEPNQVLNLTLPKGEKGNIGLTGPKGDTGEQGPQGIQGEVGPQGETGPQGIQGEKGDKGEKGDTGEVNPLVNNLVNYYLKTETYTKEEVKNLINAVKTIQMEVVTELPETGQNNIIYLVTRNKQETSNIYDEFIYVNETWEKIGSTDVDLTNYALKSEIPIKNSQLQNDSGFITGYTETDPTVPNYVKAISEADIASWNNKTDGESIQDIINGGGKTSIKSFDAGIYRFTSFGALGYQKYTGPDGKEYTIYKNDLLMVVKDKSTSTRLSWILMNNSGNIYIGSGKRTISFPFVSNEIADANSTLDGYILTSGNALSKLNTTEYVPTSDYNPTTKKYVDDTIKSKINATFTLDGTTLNINTEA